MKYVKQCPVCGQRYTSDDNYCPKHDTLIKLVDTINLTKICPECNKRYTSDSNYCTQHDYLVKLRNLTDYEQQVYLEYNNPSIEYEKYSQKINELKNEYYYKEQLYCEIVEKKFPAPQISNDEFMTIINQSNKIFKKELESINTILSLSYKITEEITNELNNKISILQKIISQIEKITDELILNIEKTETPKNNEIEDLFSELTRLTNTINEYH